MNSLQSRTRHQPENLGNCQRTIVVLPEARAKSRKNAGLYLLCFQSSAARPQARAKKLCNPVSRSVDTVANLRNRCGLETSSRFVDTGASLSPKCENLEIIRSVAVLRQRGYFVFVPHRFAGRAISGIRHSPDSPCSRRVRGASVRRPISWGPGRRRSR